MAECQPPDINHPATCWPGSHRDSWVQTWRGTWQTVRWHFRVEKNNQYHCQRSPCKTKSKNVIKQFVMKGHFKTDINHTPCALFCMRKVGNPHCAHLCIPSDCAVPTGWQLVRLDPTRWVPLVSDQDREQQHCSQSKVATPHVEMTAPASRVSLCPISALNNGFSFLFILLCLAPSALSCRYRWPALVIIIVAGYHRKKAATSTKITVCLGR